MGKEPTWVEGYVGMRLAYEDMGMHVFMVHASLHTDKTHTQTHTRTRTHTHSLTHSLSLTHTHRFPLGQLGRSHDSALDVRERAAPQVAEKKIGWTRYCDILFPPMF